MAKKGTFTCGTSPGYPQRERWARLAELWVSTGTASRGYTAKY